MITQARLKELLHYDPDTGVFTRKVSVSWNGKAGDEPGSIFRHRRTRYRNIMLDGIMCKAHRLAWLYTYEKFPVDQIDHIDGDGLNNRIKNLRDVTSRENSRNTRLIWNSKSGTMGVSFCNEKGMWRARINTSSGRKHLGRFIDVEDAIAARKAAEIEYGYHENHGRTS